MRNSSSVISTASVSERPWPEPRPPPGGGPTFRTATVKERPHAALRQETGPANCATVVSTSRSLTVAVLSGGPPPLEVGKAMIKAMIVCIVLSANHRLPHVRKDMGHPPLPHNTFQAGSWASGAPIRQPVNASWNTAKSFRSLSPSSSKSKHSQSMPRPPSGPSRQASKSA